MNPLTNPHRDRSVTILPPRTNVTAIDIDYEEFMSNHECDIYEDHEDGMIMGGYDDED